VSIIGCQLHNDSKTIQFLDVS